MTGITVDVSEAVKKLDPEQMHNYVMKALDGAADLVRADIKQYPPKPPDSTYRRTFTLHNSWAKFASFGRLQAIIGSNVSYAPYVQDADRQAWMHRGRWQTTKDVAERRAKDIRQFIERALARWAR